MVPNPLRPVLPTNYQPLATGIFVYVHGRPRITLMEQTPSATSPSRIPQGRPTLDQGPGAWPQDRS